MRWISDKLLIQEDPALYFFINQGCLTVDNMDDKEEMKIVDVRQFFFFTCICILGPIALLLQKQCGRQNGFAFDSGQAQLNSLKYSFVLSVFTAC